MRLREVLFNVILSGSSSMSFRAESRNLSSCIVALNQISRLRLAAPLEMTERERALFNVISSGVEKSVLLYCCPESDLSTAPAASLEMTEGRDISRLRLAASLEMTEGRYARDDIARDYSPERRKSMKPGMLRS